MVMNSRVSCFALVCGFSGALFGYSQAHALSGFSDFSNVKPVSSIISVSDSQLEDAKSFVDSMASEAIGFLGNADLSEDQKESRFRTLLTNSFDMNTIGRFALGRYWRTASAEQRADYQTLFSDMIIEVYSRRFGEYDGQALDVRSARADNEKDVTVQSFIVSNAGQEIQVDWRVRKKGSDYKVIDVMVEGVSMALTQRSDFSSVIQRGGGEVSVLLAHLRK